MGKGKSKPSSSLFSLQSRKPSPPVVDDATPERATPLAPPDEEGPEKLVTVPVRLTENIRMYFVRKAVERMTRRGTGKVDASEVFRAACLEYMQRNP